jgi:hypothetical protein
LLRTGVLARLLKRLARMETDADETPSRRKIGGLALEDFMSDTLIANRGLDSMRATLRLSVVMVLGMVMGAFILGYATPLHLTPKAMIVDHDGVFSGRLVTNFTQ